MRHHSQWPLKAKWYGCLFLAAITCLPFSGFAQGAVTKVFIVRHADRAGNGDDLTAAGVTRSYELKRVLANAKIDSIYSTGYVRTRKTAMPLAKYRSLPIRLYSDTTFIIKHIMSKCVGKKVLVVGHSNTADDLIRRCGCTPPASIDPEMPVTQYDNLFLVLLHSVPGQKKPTCELIHMKYGEVTN
jgi:broad specificity phosphatase PhoE